MQAKSTLSPSFLIHTGIQRWTSSNLYLIYCKKQIPDTKFEPDEQVSQFLLDLHGKRNITRSQVSSIANSVVEYLFQPLLNSVSGSKETELIDKVEICN